MTQYWGGGGTRHFFLLNLYNIKKIGGARAPLPPPPTPRSLVRVSTVVSTLMVTSVMRSLVHLEASCCLQGGSACIPSEAKENHDSRQRWSAVHDDV